MNRLSTEKRVQILSALCEGSSVNAAARQTGASKVTILKLLAEIGTATLDFQQRTFVNLPCKVVEVDEIWSFVGSKDRNTPKAMRRSLERGDVWTWTAICADTKLVPCWHVGLRDANAAALFLTDLRTRLAGRIQLTSDGHSAYYSAVEYAFGWNGVDYAMLVKIFGPSPEGERRYSPGVVISAEKETIMGNPDPARVSTAFAERANLTMRMSMRRFTKLTNAFSKKLENHIHALSLYFIHYNFCRPHMTLTKENGGIKRTPAMAAGLTDHVWKLEEVVALLDEK